LYIAIASLLASAEIALWCRLAYGDNPSLVLMRSQQFYAWLAIGLLAFALTIGPVYKLFPDLGGKFLMRDARRLIGISGAWFASLHVAIAYVTQYGGSDTSVVSAFTNRSSLLGLGALLILLALAFTSFDRAIRDMGIWWFRLHRLIYTAGFLSVLHAFMIGTHASTLPALLAVCATMLALLICHVTVALRQPKPSSWQWLTITVAFLLLIVIGNYGVQRYTERVILTTAGHSHQ